jgi:hypothetical protein
VGMSFWRVRVRAGAAPGVMLRRPEHGAELLPGYEPPDVCASASWPRGDRDVSFTVTHRDGAMDADPPGDWLTPLIAELEVVDDEHPDVAVCHDESGWSLSAFPSGLVVWENFEADTAERREVLTRGALSEAFVALSRGDVRVVESILARSQR